METVVWQRTTKDHPEHTVTH